MANSIFLDRNGCEVDNVDGPAVAIGQGTVAAMAAGVKVNFFETNLKGNRIEERRYDLIIDFNCLDRNIVPEIVRGLKSGGAVLFEIFTIRQPEFGPPRNPACLLKENELLCLFKGLHIACCREGMCGERDQKKDVAALLAFKKQALKSVLNRIVVTKTLRTQRN